MKKIFKDANSEGTPHFKATDQRQDNANTLEYANRYHIVTRY